MPAIIPIRPANVNVTLIINYLCKIPLKKREIVFEILVRSDGHFFKFFVTTLRSEERYFLLLDISESKKFFFCFMCYFNIMT